MGVPEEACGDIQVALSEACANVVRHAAGVFDYSVTLAILPEGACEIEVVDLGSEFDLPALDGLDAEAEAGRGLFLMRELVDDFQFLREHNATRVRLVKRWPVAVERSPGASPAGSR
jgi:serine/threonine-protein kinase RsbW